MAYDFGALVFTPAVKALQERYGSRNQYARREDFEDLSRPAPDGLGPDEQEFVGERDSFYMASVGSTGWPYVQYRGGPKGFLKVIEARTLAFADFRGNRQYITAGNLATDDRVALIMVDYPRQARIKILGRVEIFDGQKAREWEAKVRDPDYKATVERVYVIHVEAFDWNCPQHIVPRFTEQEIRSVLAPVEKQMSDFERENDKLKKEIARLKKSVPDSGKD